MSANKFIPIGPAAACSARAYHANAPAGDRARPWPGALPVGEVAAAELVIGRELRGDSLRWYAAAFREEWDRLARATRA